MTFFLTNLAHNYTVVYNFACYLGLTRHGLTTSRFADLGTMACKCQIQREITPMLWCPMSLEKTSKSHCKLVKMRTLIFNTLIKRVNGFLKLYTADNNWDAIICGNTCKLIVLSLERNMLSSVQVKCSMRSIFRDTNSTQVRPKQSNSSLSWIGEFLVSQRNWGDPSMGTSSLCGSC